MEIQGGVSYGEKGGEGVGEKKSDMGIEGSMGRNPTW